jgi:hypothetical protein
MIKLEEQWELSINILSHSKRVFNLYIEYPTIIRSSDDLEDIVSFLEPYLIKHREDYFEINDVGEFKINNNNLLFL